MNEASLLFLYAWVKVCAGACLCVKDIVSLPRCRPCDNRFQSGFLSHHRAFFLSWWCGCNFCLQTVCRQQFYSAYSGCVYFHRMAELLEISIYFLYRNFIIAVFLKLIYVFDLNLRVYSVLFNKIIVLSKPKPKYIWFMIILFLGSRLWFYDYVCNEYEELILWGLFNWF